MIIHALLDVRDHGVGDLAGQHRLKIGAYAFDQEDGKNCDDYRDYQMALFVDENAVDDILDQPGG